MTEKSNYIEAHKKKVAEAYCSILKLSVSPGNNIYDGAILSKCITCIEHMLKATYILKFNDEINFDVNHTSQVAILDKIKKKLNYSYTGQSLNQALVLLLKNKGILSDEFYNVYSSINPERNNETHKTADVSQEAIIKGLRKIKSICNWFFSQFNEYDWEENNIVENLRAYETKFMTTLSSYLTEYSTSARAIPKNLEVITKDYFDKEVVSEEQKKKITIDYYLKFNNSWSYIKRVIANDIHITPSDIFKIKIQGEDEEKGNVKIEELIKIAVKGQPVLIKIAAVGGVGVSSPESLPFKIREIL